MKLNSDLIVSLVTLASALGICLIYAIRLQLRGRAQFDRVNRQGGSAILSKEWMELGYWAFEPLGKFFVWLGLSPNTISWFSLVLGTGVTVLLAQGHFGWAGLLAIFSAVMDMMDGYVARVRKISSNAGEILDASIDRYAELLFCLGLAVYYRPYLWMTVLIWAAGIGSFMVSYSTAKAEALQVAPPKGGMRRPERAVYMTLGVLLAPLTGEWSVVIAVAGVALLANLSAIHRLTKIAKATRQS